MWPVSPPGMFSGRQNYLNDEFEYVRVETRSLQTELALIVYRVSALDLHDSSRFFMLMRGVYNS
jgi:hypothetical protein